MMKYIQVFILCFFLNNFANAQVTTAISAGMDSVVLGEPFTLDLIIKIPVECNPQSVQLPHPDSVSNIYYPNDTVLFEKYADWTILDSGIWEGKIDNAHKLTWTTLQIEAEAGFYNIRHNIKVAVYNIGLFRFIPPKVNCENNFETLSGNSIEILVVPPYNSTSSDTLHLAPVRDIYTEPRTLEDWLPWLAGILVILLLSVSGYYIYKRRKQLSSNEPTVKEEIKPIPAEIALSALNHLRDKKLWQQGFIKQYQTELTHIIRKYIEDQFFIPALEMTSGELQQSLRLIGLPESELSLMNEVLTIADLVKFAKAEPGSDILEKFHEMAVSFVNNTKSYNVAT